MHIFHVFVASEVGCKSAQHRDNNCNAYFYDLIKFDSAAGTFAYWIVHTQTDMEHHTTLFKTIEDNLLLLYFIET